MNVSAHQYDYTYTPPLVWKKTSNYPIIFVLAITLHELHVHGSVLHTKRHVSNGFVK